MFVVHGFPPEQFGGTEMYTYYLAKEFARRGMEVHVLYTCPDEGPLPYRATVREMDGITCWRVPIRSKHVASLEETYRDIVVDSEFCVTMKKVKPDLVHFTYLLGGLSASMVPVCRELGVPNVVTLTDFAMMCPRGQLLQPNVVQCVGPGDSRMCAWCMAVETAEYLNYLDWLREIGDMAEPSDPAPAPVWRRGLKRLLWALPARDAEKAKLERRLWDLWSGLRASGNGVGTGNDAQLPQTPSGTGIPEYFPGIERAEKDYMARSQYLRRILNSADCVIAPTKYLGQKFIGWGLDEKLLKFSEYGIDDSSFVGLERKPAGRVRFGYIGQILPHKGLKVLLEAFQMLGDTTATLTVYGDTDYPPAQAYCREIAGLAENPAVKMAGTFPPEKVAEVLADLDVLVVPSLWAENSPLVVRNALLAKLPMVVSDVEGLTPYVKDEVNGMTFKTGSVEELHACLQKIVVQPDLIEKYSDGSLPTKTISEDADGLQVIYDGLLESKHVR